MRAIVEKLDDSFYMDIIISPQDIEKIKEGEMMHTFAYDDNVYFYIGTRITDRKESEKIETKQLWQEEEYNEYCE